MLPPLSFTFPSRNIKWGAVATLVNSIIGVSILAMPHCFVRCGVILGTALLAGSAILTIVSCNLLFSAAAMSTTVGILRGSLAPPSYQIVALRTLGPWAKLLAEIAISALLFGIAISYFVIIGDLGPDLLRHLFFSPTPESTPYFSNWVNRLMVLVPLTYGVALPLSMQPDFSGRTTYFVNATALTAYLLLACRIVLGALQLASSTPVFTPYVLLSVNIIHPFSLLPSLSIFILSMSCQFQLLSLCMGEDAVSVVDARRAAKIAVVLAAVLYWCIGVFGYAALLLLSASSTTSNVIPGDIFLTLNQMGMFDSLLKFGFVMALIAGFPLIIIPIRNCLYTMVVCCQPLTQSQVLPSPKPGSTSSDNMTLLVPSANYVKYSTVGLLSLCLFLAIAFPDMEFVLELTGSTAGICVCYILPALMYAFAVKRQNRSFGNGTESPPYNYTSLRLYLAYGMAGFGMCIALVAVFIPSMALVTDDEHVILKSASTDSPLINSHFASSSPNNVFHDSVDSPSQIEKTFLEKKVIS